MKRMRRCFMVSVVAFLSMTFFAVKAFPGVPEITPGAPPPGLSIDKNAPGEKVRGTMFALAYGCDGSYCYFNVIMNLQKGDNFKTLFGTTPEPVLADTPSDAQASIFELMKPKISAAFFKGKNIKIKVKDVHNYARLDDTCLADAQCSILVQATSIPLSYMLTNIEIAVTQ